MLSLSLTLDILLLMVSAVAIMYCAQLNRRLKSLHSLDDGVGQAILKLTETIKQSRDAGLSIAQQARDAASELDQAIGRVENERLLAEDALQVLDGQVHSAKQKIGDYLANAQQQSDQLNSVAEEARTELLALKRGVDIASKIHSALVSQISRGRTMPRESVSRPAPLAERATVYGPTVVSNPFRNDAKVS